MSFQSLMSMVSFMAILEPILLAQIWIDSGWIQTNGFILKFTIWKNLYQTWEILNSFWIFTVIQENSTVLSTHAITLSQLFWKAKKKMIIQAFICSGFILTLWASNVICSQLKIVLTQSQEIKSRQPELILFETWTTILMCLLFKLDFSDIQKAKR